MEYIAFDSHKRYTLASVEKLSGGQSCELRLAHQPGSIRQFLSRWTPGSPVALETIGNWYWIVDDIEEAGMVPRLVHARKAKLMMAMVNKTDKLDARGLNRLQHTGTLPHSLDPFPRAARPARAASHAHGVQPSAHAAEKRHSCYLSQIWAEHPAGLRSVRQADPAV